MDKKKEFLDKLAGKPWVRLREIANLQESIEDHWSEEWGRLDAEGVRIWGRATDTDLSNKEHFGFGPEHWRNLADRLEEDE